jgi:hypothetical protein
VSERDRKLAAKYAAQGRKSATETARERATRPSRGSRTVETPASSVPDNSGGGVMGAMRRVLAEPRTDASRDRAAAHKRNLPPLP